MLFVLSARYVLIHPCCACCACCAGHRQRAARGGHAAAVAGCGWTLGQCTAGAGGWGTKISELLAVNAIICWRHAMHVPCRHSYPLLVQHVDKTAQDPCAHRACLLCRVSLTGPFATIETLHVRCVSCHHCHSCTVLDWGGARHACMSDAGLSTSVIGETVKNP